MCRSHDAGVTGDGKEEGHEQGRAATFASTALVPGVATATAHSILLLLLWWGWR